MEIKSQFIVLLMVIVFVFHSCEERPVTIPEFVPPSTDKVVLIEEFSGVRCPNCPAGTTEIKRLGNLFDTNLVAVAYYTKFLGQPLEESKYNFLTEEAEELESLIGPYLGKPAATINRIQFPSEDFRLISGTGSWQGYVEQELQEDSQIRLIGTVEYNDENRNANINIRLTPARDLDGSFQITVLITESEIIDAQLFPNDSIAEEYEHNHVFRTFLTDVRGNNISQNLQESRTLSFDYNVELSEEWVAENCHIVAFVEDVEDSSNRRILQAMELELIE